MWAKHCRYPICIEAPKDTHHPRIIQCPWQGRLSEWWSLISQSVSQRWYGPAGDSLDQERLIKESWSQSLSPYSLPNKCSALKGLVAESSSAHLGPSFPIKMHWQPEVSCYLLFFYFEIVSPSLEVDNLGSKSQPSCLHLPEWGITGTRHHTKILDMNSRNTIYFHCSRRNYVFPFFSLNKPSR